MRAWAALFARQIALVLGAVLAYFGVRGLTEGNVDSAHAHARGLLDLERVLGIDIEQRFQHVVVAHEPLMIAANWVYIWLHWPLLTVTFIWLLIAHRDRYVELRNAIFISGAIGLLIYVSFPTAPPRLFSAEFIDTVTLHSHSYRVLQPPGLVNKYAAMPSLHVGWNVLAGYAWWHAGRRGDRGIAWSIAAISMPIAMATATVATGNHWVLDGLVGSAIALVGLGMARELARRTHQVDDLPVANRAEVSIVLADRPEGDRGLDREVLIRRSPELSGPTGRCHRNGEDDATGTAGAGDSARGARGRPRREPVVDHDHDLATERPRRAPATQQLRPAGQFGPLVALDRRELLRRDPQ